MALSIDLYSDIKATANFAREMALAARISIAANPGTRTPEQLQAGLDSLGVVATRADQVLRALLSKEEANG